MKTIKICFALPMLHNLAYDEIKFDVKLEDFLNSSEYSNMNLFLEFDLCYLDATKEKTKHFPKLKFHLTLNLVTI